MSAELQNKLKMSIERAVSKLIEQISEHVIDFTYLYSRRNGIELDPNQLKQTLEIVKLGIKDGFLTKIDLLNSDIQKSLNEFVAEKETPLSLTSKK